MEKIKQLIEKYGIWGTIIVIVAYLTIAVITTSCNVTRTITTTSTSYQKGDTTTIISTKTIESYDATKR